MTELGLFPFESEQSHLDIVQVELESTFYFVSRNSIGIIFFSTYLLMGLTDLAIFVSFLPISHLEYDLKISIITVPRVSKKSPTQQMAAL